MSKQKLLVEEQIKYMKVESGIDFNIINEEEAKHFLTYNNYYFKIKAYAKNYEKYCKGDLAGKYINLEFAYLVELSILDMYFRRFIIKMTLDIEHYLKTMLLRDFNNNSDEDGYNIVSSLYLKYPYIKDNIHNKGNHSACTDLVSKYRDDFAIWNIVEVLSFGDFIKLYEMYYKKYSTSGSMENFLWSVKFIRNAAAHNNCLINSLRIPYSSNIRPNKQINTFISKIDGISTSTRIKRMKNPVIHDFVVSLYVFNNVVTSANIKKNTMVELNDFMETRMVVNKKYFMENQVLTSSYNFIKIIVDYFYSLSI